MRNLRLAACSLVPTGLQLPFAALGLSLAILLSSPANSANEPTAYEAHYFERAQVEGRTIVVESYANWCLACRIQAPILSKLRGHAPFESVTVLRVDEKTPAKVWKQFRLAGYGMLIVFKGRQEVSRGSPTSEAEMTALIQRGL